MRAAPHTQASGIGAHIRRAPSTSAASTATDAAFGAKVLLLTPTHTIRGLGAAPRRLAGSAPSWIRTSGLLLRRESLYPAELSGLAAIVRAEPPHPARGRETAPRRELQCEGLAREDVMTLRGIGARLAMGGA